MKLKKLLEEFKDYVKPFYTKGKERPVFINPTLKEILEIAGEKKIIRFIIDFKNKKFYAFSADMIHADVVKGLGLKEDVVKEHGWVSKGKIKTHFYGDLTSKKHPWLDRYLKGM